MATTSVKQSGLLFSLPDSLRKPQPGLRCDSGRFLPMEHDCASCGKSSFNMKSCTACWVAKYCDKTCQLSHWPAHRSECRRVACVNEPYKGGRLVEMELVPDPGSPEASINEDAIFLDLDKCPKNGYNSHTSFISVKEFTMEHLPKEIRQSCVANYILAESRTAVRVLVKSTSKNRPDTDPCARSRGSRSMRTASGKFVLDNPHIVQTKNCPIPHCHRKRDLGPDHKIYEADLKVFTNKHVLYDEDELNHTEVDFFYDSDDKVSLVKEYATKLFYTKPSSDKTFFNVSIHDEDLLRKLEEIGSKICSAFRKLPPGILKSMSAFAIVISHPHGMPKKISIGSIHQVTEENITDETIVNAKEAAILERTWFESNTQENYLKFIAGLGRLDLPVYKIWYDTPTCQGSSGSPVLFGGRRCSKTWGPYMAVHSAYDFDSKLNFFKVVMFME